MDRLEVQGLVAGWVQGWNDHDVERVLSHFTDDAVFTSPLAGQLGPREDGVVRGKTALREYWSEGLRRAPDLHFEVVGTYVGGHTIVINYGNQKGGLVNEVLLLDGPLGREGHAMHLSDNPNPLRGPLPDR